VPTTNPFDINRMTSSRLPTKDVYGPADLVEAGFDPDRDLGTPARYPFTRGRKEHGYGDGLWDMATYSGISSPTETNARFRYIVANTHSARNTLAMALDLPSQIGLDPDHPMSRGEIGRSGVSVTSLRDVEAIYDGIPLDRVRLATVANGMGNVAAAWFIGLGLKRGVPMTDVVGNLQNDPLKEFTGRGTYIYPAADHVRLALDVVEHCIEHLPHWKPMSVCGSQLRWGGATAIEEVGFAIAHTEGYLDGLVERGVNVLDALPRLEFHMVADNDVLEEVAKFRALRRIWAARTARRYGLNAEQVSVPSVQIYTAGYTLTAQDPLNNVVRIAMQVMASVMGGVDYVATSSYDEAISTPTLQALRVALHTQQIVAFESGLARVADPLGGSYYVESLTSRIAAAVESLLDEIETVGGIMKAIESGWTNGIITEAAYTFQREIERGERVVVGVNRFVHDDDGAHDVPPQSVDPQLEERRIAEVAELRRGRSSREVSRCLADISAAVRAGKNTLPSTIDAVLAYATIGEICDVFRENFGEYRGA
jgi:methylmalonyl-CoA mutase N-terminal domain/subunit